MDKNQIYMQNLKLEDVPWNRITTAYGRASNFPNNFQTIWNMESKKKVKAALGEITSDIEHQSTLWQATPFAIIFLVRVFENAIPKIDTNPCAKFVVEYLLDFFFVIADCCNDLNDTTLVEEYPLPYFADMIQEDYLFPEKYNNEEDEEEEDDYSLLDDILYSFWYYSYQALSLCLPALEKLSGTPFYKEAQDLKLILKSILQN